MTRRFDIGPFVLAFGALVLLVGLFLDWYGAFNAWSVFEFVDLLLAALAVASVIGAVGLLTPEADYIDKRALPWLVGVSFVVVAAQLMDPPPAAAVADVDIGLGAWLSLGGAALMVGGAVLSFSKVSFAVAVEGRDRRQRVAAVDHRPPPTETGQQPVARSSTSLLHPRPSAEEEPPEARETS